ncbi:C-C motif chemokine 4-like [Sminthopsis crassicaudata]|uniref:C-C motif chemokine 4-like n=1 Tax=Sminthopsis crassicaudata TaxID=9301 RepID=UPI003D69639E
MKFFVVALSILMVMAFNFPECSAITGPGHSDTCCFHYVKNRISRNSVIGYYKTSSRCSQPGVVFFNNENWEICANPKHAWVQDYMNDLKLKATGVQNNES